MNAIKKWRSETGTTQVQLAERLGVAQSVVARWEAESVGVKRVLLVSDVTGIPPHVLRPDVYPVPADAA